MPEAASHMLIQEQYAQVCTAIVPPVGGGVHLFAQGVSAQFLTKLLQRQFATRSCFVGLFIGAEPPKPYPEYKDSLAEVLRDFIRAQVHNDMLPENTKAEVWDGLLPEMRDLLKTLAGVCGLNLEAIFDLPPATAIPEMHVAAPAA